MSQPLGAVTAEASVAIAADPAAVYALITDLPTLCTLAEEANAMEWHKGDSVTPGACLLYTSPSPRD